MEKISHQKISEVLTASAAALRSITSERDALAVKCASYERRQEAEKIAHDMRAKGISDEPVETLIANLEKMAEDGKLGSFKEAVELVGPNMGQKFASLTTDDKTYGGTNELERYLTDGN
jgi:hypothetical protein